MLELLQKLFIGHAHRWETDKVLDVSDGTQIPAGKIYVLKCIECGNIKVKRVEWI